MQKVAAVLGMLSRGVCVRNAQAPDACRRHATTSADARLQCAGLRPCLSWLRRVSVLPATGRAASTREQGECRAAARAA